MFLSIGLGAVGAGIVGDLIYLGTIASVFGFSREKEMEADMIGYDHAVAAGYDPHAGARLWSNLIAEARASDNPDVRRREARASIFATHPLSADRVEALTERAARREPRGETHRERYRAAIRPFLDEWLRAELRRRDFSQTLVVLDRLARARRGPGRDRILSRRGEPHPPRRRRRRARGRRTTPPPSPTPTRPPPPGANWARSKPAPARNDAAAAHFRTYLERAPQAGDRALVEARARRN